MSKFRIAAAVAAAVITIGTGAVTVSAQDKDGAPKARQDLMKAQGADLRVIKAFADGQGDQAAALEKANDLVALSAKLPSLFIAGTSSKEMAGKTNAKPDIWTDRAKFEATAATLHADAEKLAAAVKAGDKTATADQFKAVGGVCGNCHTTFREKMS